MDKYILGIDPGLSGALAWLNLYKASLTVVDMPTWQKTTKSKKRSLDIDGLARLLDEEADITAAVFIEQASARPGEGVGSSHVNGYNYGCVLGVAAAYFIPREIVHPATWKKAMRVPAAKDGARAKASEAFPRYANLFARAKDDGRAEAALIALYGWKKWQEGSV